MLAVVSPAAKELVPVAEKWPVRSAKWMEGCWIHILKDTETMRTLAASLIQCHYGYACISWFSGMTTNLKDELQTAQNKLMRIILKL